MGPELNKISIGTGKLNVGSEDLGRGKEENERNNNERSNEGKNMEQRKSAEGDQPSILNWLRGRYEQ